MSYSNRGNNNYKNDRLDDYGETGARGGNTVFASSRRNDNGPVYGNQSRNDLDYGSSNRTRSNPNYSTQRESRAGSGYQPRKLKEEDNDGVQSSGNTGLLKRDKDDYGPTGNALDEPAADNRDYDSYGSSDERYMPRNNNRGG